MRVPKAPLKARGFFKLGRPDRRGTLLATGLIAALALPTAADPFTIFIFTWAYLAGVAAMFLNLILGYGGIYFISPMIFVGIGGYTAAWLSVNAGTPPALNIFVGGILATISSFIFSLISTRLRGLYMALFSVIFTLLLGSLVVQSDPRIYYWTGGPLGVYGVPDITLGELEFRTLAGIPYYYTTLGLLIVSGVVVSLFLKSKFGLALRSLRDGEVYSSTLGVNSFMLKVFVFALAGFFMGIVGGIWAHFFASMTPPIFSIIWILNFLSMLVFGGFGTLLGPVVGAIILLFIDQNLLIFGAVRFVIIGILVIVVLLLLPSGIVGKIESLVGEKAKKPPAELSRMLLARAFSAEDRIKQGH